MNDKQDRASADVRDMQAREVWRMVEEAWREGDFARARRLVIYHDVILEDDEAPL